MNFCFGIFVFPFTQIHFSYELRHYKTHFFWHFYISINSSRRIVHSQGLVLGVHAAGWDEDDWVGVEAWHSKRPRTAHNTNMCVRCMNKKASGTLRFSGVTRNCRHFLYFPIFFPGTPKSQIISQSHLFWFPAQIQIKCLNLSKCYLVRFVVVLIYPFCSPLSFRLVLSHGTDEKSWGCCAEVDFPVRLRLLWLVFGSSDLPLRL